MYKQTSIATTWGTCLSNIKDQFNNFSFLVLRSSFEDENVLTTIVVKFRKVIRVEDCLKVFLCVWED